MHFSTENVKINAVKYEFFYYLCRYTADKLHNQSIIFIIFNKEGNFTNLSYMSMFVGKGIKQSVNNIVNRKIIENH